MLLTQYKGTGTLHNPSLLVEVLSPSTRDYDLGDKLERYQTIPTLRDVLLIDPKLPDVRHVRRTAEGWETRRFLALSDTIDLAEVILPLATIYADVPEDLD
jgi:Uma2 family endonuclease